MGSIEMFRIMHFEKSGHASAQAPTGTPRSSYRTLATAKNWHEYFTEISDKGDSVGNFIKSDFSLDEAILQALPDLELQQGMRRVRLFLLLATEVSTMPLTVLAALEENLKDLSTRQTVSIHIVGATGREFHNLPIFEEILHLVPSLQTINITLIGPRSVAVIEQTKNEIILQCCNACSSHGRKRTVALYTGLYHDYVKESMYQKPDLAVLFNSGRSQEEEESWLPTTKFLVESGTLTLCTTYNHREAQEEVAELDRLGARLIKGPEVNKWKSLLPVPELLETEEHAVYYINYYRYVFQGRR
jgi:splicing suppressor protein 51